MGWRVRAEEGKIVRSYHARSWLHAMCIYVLWRWRGRAPEIRRTID